MRLDILPLTIRVNVGPKKGWGSLRHRIEDIPSHLGVENGKLVCRNGKSSAIVPPSTVGQLQYHTRPTVFSSSLQILSFQSASSRSLRGAFEDAVFSSPSTVFVMLIKNGEANSGFILHVNIARTLILLWVRSYLILVFWPTICFVFARFH